MHIPGLADEPPSMADEVSVLFKQVCAVGQRFVKLQSKCLSLPVSHQHASSMLLPPRPDMRSPELADEPLSTADEVSWPVTEGTRQLCTNGCASAAPRLCLCHLAI